MQLIKPLGILGAAILYPEPFRSASPDLRQARLIDLTRAAGSPEATALVDAVVSLVVPHLSGPRSLGPKKLDTIRSDVATVLGGFLRAGMKGRAAAAQARPGGALWQFNSLMGRRRFWRLAEAMRLAGLAAMVPGIKVSRPPSQDDANALHGEAARLWATGVLMALAARHGLTPATVARDWPISRAAEIIRPVIAHDGLVVCRSLERQSNTPATLSTDQAAMAARYREQVATLNNAVAKADIRGCLAPIFIRRFAHDLRLGGRLYATGASNVQTMPRDERSAITINGETVAEPDIHASQLTVFLALTGTRALPSGDLYAVGGLPRAVVKAWMVQTFATGRLVTTWANGVDDAVRAVSASDVRRAVIAAYPAFALPMERIVPPDILKGLTIKQRGWAVGQYLTFKESEAVTSAIAYVMDCGGVPALPIHDALIVPTSAAAHAVTGLTQAFVSLFGIVPRIV